MATNNKKTSTSGVVVLGAGGYIGLAVATELASRGHTVYGVIRSDAYARELRKNEIVPVIEASLSSNLSALDTYFERSSTVIDATGDESLAIPRAVVAHLETVAARTSTTKHFIFTSGCLVYESTTADKPVNESSPVSAQMPRSAFDAELVAGKAHPHVHATVLRPAWVYGLSSGKLLAGLGFFPSSSSPSPHVVHGNGAAVWPWIHISDLSRAYADVVEAADARTFGQVFNVSDNVSLAPRREVHEAFARAAGFSGAVEFAPSHPDPFSKLLDKNIPFKSNKLHDATGWMSRIGSITDATVAQRVVAAAAAHASK